MIPKAGIDKSGSIDVARRGEISRPVAEVTRHQAPAAGISAVLPADAALRPSAKLRKGGNADDQDEDQKKLAHCREYTPGPINIVLVRVLNYDQGHELAMASARCNGAADRHNSHTGALASGLGRPALRVVSRPADSKPVHSRRKSTVRSHRSGMATGRR